MNTVLTSTVNAEFLSLTGKEFDAAVKGVWGDGEYIQEPWMLSPEIKYYYPRYPVIRDADKRQFFLCVETSPCKSNNGFKEAVAILELQESPYDNNVMWLKYISVREDRQGRGISKKLVDMMVIFLKSNPHHLERSFASEEGKMRIKGYID
jgi:GNAT superfamily N-acetyltransferase